jgi:hypothetical protein
VSDSAFENTQPATFDSIRMSDEIVLKHAANTLLPLAVAWSPAALAEARRPMNVAVDHRYARSTPTEALLSLAAPFVAESLRSDAAGAPDAAQRCADASSLLRACSAAVDMIAPTARECGDAIIRFVDAAARDALPAAAARPTRPASLATVPLIADVICALLQAEPARKPPPPPPISYHHRR